MLLFVSQEISMLLFSSLTQQIRGKASKFGYYTHDVRVPYPPKLRSKVWRLPVHRKLLFVTNGHVNDYSGKVDEAPKARQVTAVVFAKCNTYKMIENFTRAEIEFIFDNAAKIREMFDKEAANLPKLEEEREKIKNRYMCR